MTEKGPKKLSITLKISSHRSIKKKKMQLFIVEGYPMDIYSHGADNL